MIYTDKTDSKGWMAYDDNYDGAPDADPIVGYGETEDDALNEYIIEAMDRNSYWREFA